MWQLFLGLYRNIERVRKILTEDSFSSILFLHVRKHEYEIKVGGLSVDDVPLGDKRLL